MASTGIHRGCDLQMMILRRLIDAPQIQWLFPYQIKMPGPGAYTEPRRRYLTLIQAYRPGIVASRSFKEERYERE